MEKQEFIETLERMVKFYSSLADFSPAGYMESAVERWAKVHPTKTRQTEFLKQFPRAVLDDAGSINFCPLKIDSAYGDCKCYEHCSNCRRAYWSKEIE